MKYTSKKLEKSQIELIITVEPADYEKDLQEAAVRLSQRAAIKGFRPGKAPYDMVKQQMGDLKIFEEATQAIVEKNFYQAVTSEKLQTVGMPQITITKVAPGNDFEFKAVVALLPKIKIADLSKIKVEREAKKITDKEVDGVINELKKMQTKEVLKNGKATKDDKIVVDMDMFIDKVAMEGGQAKNHQIYLNEACYIPGLTEQLIGLGKGDTKEFSVQFPKENYQKLYAGKDVDVKVVVKDVYELQAPAIDDEFCKKLGQENVAKLRELLQKNLEKEAKQKDEQRVEAEVLNKVVEASEFEEIPEILLDSEKHKMFHELEHSLEHQGLTMEQYLKDLKKTEEEIHNEFAEGAAKRVKSALISREIAKENNLSAAKEEIQQEADAIRKAYPNDKTVEDNLKRPEVLDTIATMVQNKKVVEWLKEKIAK